MRDMGTTPVSVPFDIRHIHPLSSRDILPALQDAQQDRRHLKRGCAFRWEPVSARELISFHRQLFLWQILMNRPHVLLNAAALRQAAQNHPSTRKPNR